jgi:hypothetical protein
MVTFIDAQRLSPNHLTSRVPTVSSQLDELTGGIGSGAMYLFYGGDDLTEDLFTHLVANSLTQTDLEPIPEAVYVIRGNYWKERITMDTEGLTRLLESHDLDMKDALRRVRILVASSADQQMNLNADLSAFTYTDSLGLMDLILPTGVVNDRKVAEKLSRRLSDIERRIMRLEERRGD